MPAAAPGQAASAPAGEEIVVTGRRLRDLPVTPARDPRGRPAILQEFAACVRPGKG